MSARDFDATAATPVISNLASKSEKSGSDKECETSSVPPPLELPQPALDSVDNHQDEAGEGQSAIEKVQKEDESDAPPEAAADPSTAAAPRFSSPDEPPIVLKHWPSSEKEAEDTIPQTISVETKIQGIPNHGQTCFMNSVLQSLSSLASFDVYLKSQLRAARRMRFCPYLKYDENEDEDETLFVTRLLSKGLNHINGSITAERGSTTRWDPRLLLETVAQTHAQFASPNQQQDAQEFMTTLLDVLVQEQDLLRRFRQKRSKRRTGSWLGGTRLPVSTPEPEAMTFPPYFSAPTVWALSPAFLQLQLSSLHVEEEEEEEDDREGQWSHEADFDEVSVASSARETAQERRHERRVVVSSASRSSDSSSSSEHSAENVVTADSEKLKKTTNGTETTRSTSTASSHSPPVKAPGEEKKHEEFELHLPRIDSDEDILPTPVAASKKTLSLEQRAADPEEDSETLSDMSSSVAAHPPAHLPAGGSHNRLQARPAERLSMPLCGWIGSTVQCRVCQHVRPIKNVPFVDLSVVPTGVGNPHVVHKGATPPPPCTIEECLDQFTQVERVEQVDCPSCTKQKHLVRVQDDVDLMESALKYSQKRKPGSADQRSIEEELNRHMESLRKWQQVDVDDDDSAEQMAALLGVEQETNEGRQARVLLRQDANKCLFLTRLPQVFCLHVQRRYYDPQTTRLSKTTQTVLFNEYLDVAPYCAYTTSPFGSGRGKKRRVLYRLAAVLEHRGGANHGHYICYRRSSDGKWWFVSDDIVRRTTWEKVRQCQAYMLFYENNQFSETL